MNINELCCNEVVEGGNLDMTQLSRMEISLTGGSSKTDYIEKSGGVDCTNYEADTGPDPGCPPWFMRGSPSTSV
ncbi:NAD-glutamate dehydrogenase domain-containing protein [Pseudomonas glycinae]|uniref:NAD-glutamate dehydrogenase domain-containing protein n=1 Tax=Pseudomonas glycinae TaxID=1785145 RepID=UPI00167E7F03|nr:NAD-glutamate dehydrogenase domain-containing protein [Pseudomonas glycinae]